MTVKLLTEKHLKGGCTGASVSTLVQMPHVVAHICCKIYKYLRNEYNFWNVRGIMNTSGLLQSKQSPKDLRASGFTLTL